MKIALEYNEDTGEVKDKNGVCIGVQFGLGDHKLNDEGQTEKICKLKASGFQVNEIMQLIREGMV